MNVRQQLDFHPFTRPLPTRLRDCLAALAAPALYRPGQLILTEGEAADRFLLIVEGKVAVNITCARQGDLTVQTVGGGEVVGWSWLSEPYEGAFDVVCLEEVLGVEVDAKRLRELMEQDHELGYRLSKRLVEVVAGRLQSTRLRLLDLYAPRVRR
jgi:CRP-like cAMP-binding protein